MIKHLVMWKLKDMGPKEKQQAINQMKTGLEALTGKIDGLVDLQVGADLLQSEQSYDVALVSTHTSLAALKAYQDHPLHKEAGDTWVKPIAKSRVCVDFEY